MATSVSQAGRVEANLQGQEEHPGQIECKFFEEHTWDRTGRAPRLKYRYEPLPDSSIRLVKIERILLDNTVLTTEALEIGISFETVTLAEAENAHYTALSYTWGPATNMEAVHCKEGSLLVTPNLYDALRVFAINHKSLFWIDQLSINQSDAAEKASQIKKMGRIFRAAESVTLWLSKELFYDEETGENLESLCTFCNEQFHWVNRNKSTISFAAWEETSYPEYQQMIKSWIPPAWWQSAAQLFSHPYFRRVWVIQEVTMAKRVEAWFGRRAFPWRNLSMAIMFLQRAYIPRGLVPPLLTRPQIEAAERLVIMDHATREDWRRATDLKGKATLFDLIIHTSGCLATDEQDKVYGLLGFLDAGHNCLAQSVEPDYSLQFNDLIHEVGRQSMLISHRLHHLSYCHPYLGEEYPSWLTDISELNHNSASPYRISDCVSLFNAGGDLPASVRSVPNNIRQLSFEVIRFGSTSTLGPTPLYSLRKRLAALRVEDFEIQRHRNDYCEFLDYLRLCFSVLLQCIPPSDDTWEIFIRAIACDSSPSDPSLFISRGEYEDLENLISLGMFDIGRDRSQLDVTTAVTRMGHLQTGDGGSLAMGGDRLFIDVLDEALENKATACLARYVDKLLYLDAAENDGNAQEQAETQGERSDAETERSSPSIGRSGFQEELIRRFPDIPPYKEANEDDDQSRTASTQRLQEIHRSIRRPETNPDGHKAGDIEPWVWHTIDAFKTLDLTFRRLTCLRFCVGTVSSALSSSSERFLAWVPEEACSTDEIVLIRGFTFPMLVRPQEDGSYRFMGICYVFQFMDGALWEEEAAAPERIVVS